MLQSLSITAGDIYMMSLIFLIVFFGLALVTAFLTPNRQGGRDKSTRRIWFWVLAVATGIFNYAYFAFVAIPDSWIKLPEVEQAMPANIQALADLNAANVWASIGVVIVFIFIGFIVSRCAPKTKLGSWF
ncbi:MAG: hypothetical protein K2J42_03565 [Muribaculaceae bacterium]|nr:hypothetical protein [Muribaculaceae bacterium]MDE6809151.1 hypothetical protein [Muribaculaceae bacterium]